MKKFLFILMASSFSLLIPTQKTKEILLEQLTFTNSSFDKSQSEVIFKGGKWNSFIKLPASINQEIPNYQSMVINIPHSTVMIRIRFLGKDGEHKDFYQPAVKSTLNRKLNLALVPFIDKIQEIKIEAEQSIDEAGNYHTLRIKSIYLTN